jgi:hypothetical protein
MPLTELFATRAKTLLVTEMESPNLSTVQSLVILSALDALRTNDACGWLKSGELDQFRPLQNHMFNSETGIAMRLAIDLGLHLDVHDYTEAGIISKEEERLRSTVFWGAFVYDRYDSIPPKKRVCGLRGWQC